MQLLLLLLLLLLGEKVFTSRAINLTAARAAITKFMAKNSFVNNFSTTHSLSPSLPLSVPLASHLPCHSALANLEGTSLIHSAS